MNGHAGSCLTKGEWLDAIGKSKAELMKIPCGDARSTDQDVERSLTHLVEMAKMDKAYAWWSAHLIESLGPQYKGLPGMLVSKMKELQDGKSV